jgi:PAS domain S-box-containing protein
MTPGSVSDLNRQAPAQPEGQVRTAELPEMRDAEAHLRSALEAGGIGAWQLDLADNKSTWWPGMELLHGLPPGSAALQPDVYDSVVHAADRELFRAAVQMSAIGDGWHRVEYRVVWPDGSVHWLEARGRVVLRDAQGRAVCMCGICQDVSRRKQSELDLKFMQQASEELAGVADLQTTLDRIAGLSVPHFADWCAIDLLQPDGRLERVAAAHVDPDKAHLAHELHRRYPPDPDSPSGTWNVIRTGQGTVVPEITPEMLERATRDPQLLGMLRELGLHSYLGAPLVARGQVLGVITFISAQSRRRYSQDDLVLAEVLGRRAAVALENAQLLAALKESDRAKDVFLATLAHELRNPLAPIWNGLSIIKRARGDPLRIDQVCAIIERQVGQLSRLVDDLLDVSRISAGKIELKKEPTNLVHIVSAAVEMSRPHIEAAHHQLSLTFPETSTAIVADPARLAQVFSNLLINAAKYTRRGGRIDLTVKAEENDLVVCVRDNGTGIAPEMLRKVFGLFTQVTHPSERRQGGLGIGLSLVDGLVRLHGGRVEAFSEGLDRGSEFVVRLPRNLPEAPQAWAAARDGAAAEAPSAQARRVLVVDDNEDAASTVADLLEMTGNEVRVANDGSSALRQVQSFKPDIILLDIGLPDINGYEVARQVRALQGVRQPLLEALTGWGQQQDKDAAAQAGFDLHWTKPVDPARLSSLDTLRGPRPVRRPS